jgi:hypothetical protein
MRRLIDLWRVMASELAIWCNTSTTNDFNTVVRRVEEEGFSFMTITLPTFAKDLEKGLEQGFVGSSDFSAFKHGLRKLPMFLSGFSSQIFDLETGLLLRDPNIDCIFAIRQLTSLFAKIELPCSTSRTVRAMQDYVEVESEVERWEEDTLESDPIVRDFLKVSRLLYAGMFASVDHRVYTNAIMPQHGPGATADGLVGNGKFCQTEWTSRLESMFPYGEYCIPNWRYYYLLDHVDFREPGAERPVRVVSVPKTLKKPRIIAIEPTCMQFMQQAISKELVRALEDPNQAVAYGMIGFSDQLPNREMARVGSLEGTLATIDLSDASDRVSNQLVRWMLADHPWLAEGVQVTRSTRAEIPELGLSLPKLRKFASMGSALCFPVEAMVFLAIAVTGILYAQGKPVSLKSVDDLRGKVRVYGDDIIVPADTAVSVIDHLEAFGLKVNRGKTFMNGKFRESCGGDFYDGVDVTPLRLRREIPTSRSSVLQTVTLVEFRNHLYQRGLWKTARYLDDIIEVLLDGHFPIVEDTSSCLGRRSFLPYKEERCAEDTHSPRVRGWVIRPVIPGSSVEDEWALLKCLTSPVMQEDARHLERSGRPAYVAINLRWVCPF